MDVRLDDATDLITPEIVLPSQYADMCSQRCLTPEAYLMWAVMEDALACATMEPKTNKQRKLQHEALLWIELREYAGPGLSFDYICEVLNLDSEALRKRVMEGVVMDIPRHFHIASNGRKAKPSVNRSY